MELPKKVKSIMSKFQKENLEIYVVGGAVRDLIMGNITKDWDFTTNAPPEKILEIIPDGFYDNIFGTVGYVVEGFDKPFEITTFRTEKGYSDSRHPDEISWGKTLQEDLMRRDFTINSMAVDSNGNLIDKFGGKSDLDNKTIKTVGEPEERFSEDALRMMRAIRIASELGFVIEELTFEAIKKNSALIDKIAKERIRDELFKILESPNPYEGIMMFKNSCLMDRILPELSKCFGVEQKSPGRHHIYDDGTHLVMSLKYCKSQDPVTRFATLIHDIGKPQTYRKNNNGLITFYNHEMVSTRIAENISDRLRFSNKEKDKFVRLVRWHQFTVDENQTDSALRRFLKNVGLENVEDMLALRVADRLGGGARETSWRLEEFKTRLIEVQKQPFAIKDLKINGLDVMKELGIEPGPKVGEILEAIFKDVVENNVVNEREDLLVKLKTLSP